MEINEERLKKTLDKSKPFINIVFDCNLQSGSFMKKKYTILQQLIIAVNSIKTRWKNISYNINLIHTDTHDSHTADILEKLGVITYKVDPDWASGRYNLARSKSYTHILKKNGTHRLIMDCDIIAINELLLNEKAWESDINVMYEYNTNVVRNQDLYNTMVSFLCNKFDLKQPTKKFVTSDNKWCNNYHITGQHLDCPYFNPGVVLIKEEIAYNFGCLYKKLWKLASGEIKIPSDLGKIKSWKIMQVAMSIYMQELASNLNVFPGGVNMIPYLVPVYEKFKNFENCQILHCCHFGYVVVDSLANHYLDNADNFLGNEFFYTEALKYKDFSISKLKKLRCGF